MTTIERIIRNQLPGNANAKARKVARSIVEGNDYTGHAAELRTLATNPHAIIPPAACLALVEELERLATERARDLARNEEIKHAIEHGCPTCGAKLRRNNSLEGWWQCSQFGAPGFRADSSKPACAWQSFLVRV